MVAVVVLQNLADEKQADVMRFFYILGILFAF